MSSVDFLFTPTVQRVLGTTLTRPDRSFTLQELLRSAAAGRGSAQQQIDRLVQAGVLVEEPRRGRQRSIRANTEFFLYPELRSIALKTFGLIEPVREALQPYADRIEKAFVFGSVVKGTDTSQSDIDVMVIGLVPQLELFEVTSRLQQTLGRRVQFNVYEPAEWRDLVANDPVVSQIAGGPRLEVLPYAKTD
ncbi:nucleotidyltransferase domain-containing protein [Roseateles toxinivorans]|uniref:Nucleotidyltransferase-like protein n=1 Tax=Roseateles toxinivorans TaxID=270368 RepID=A0A4R6QQW9_9BURK|nr:nucleotidyltransferase domain-containing protein [Roseateles toxinivorans]TDP73137.1 nucleotidyltransferase-like protein [Roseateles toxinivorans]